jgi:hypothetical protein
MIETDQSLLLVEMSSSLSMWVNADGTRVDLLR